MVLGLQLPFPITFILHTGSSQFMLYIHRFSFPDSLIVKFDWSLPNRCSFENMVARYQCWFTSSVTFTPLWYIFSDTTYICQWFLFELLNCPGQVHVYTTGNYVIFSKRDNYCRVPCPKGHVCIWQFCWGIPAIKSNQFSSSIT